MRRSNNPLPGWRAGVEPQRGTAPQPPQQQEQPQEQQLDPHGAQYRAMARATAIIRRLYGIDQLAWHKNAKLYDRQARKIYEMLMRGEAIPDAYRCQYKEPEPIDPSQWGRLGCY